MNEIIYSYLIIGFIFSFVLLAEWKLIDSLISKQSRTHKFLTIITFLSMNLFAWPYMLYLEFVHYGCEQSECEINLSKKHI